MSAAVVPLEVRVEQARRAAAAGHFRMAELYADRALQLVTSERAQCRKDLGVANRKLRSQRMQQGVASFAAGVVEVVQEALQPVADAYVELGKIFIASTQKAQKDYILTSHVEHRDQRLLDVMYAMQAGEVLTKEQRRFL